MIKKIIFFGMALSQLTLLPLQASAPDGGDVPALERKFQSAFLTGEGGGTVEGFLTESLEKMNVIQMNSALENLVGGPDRLDSPIPEHEEFPSHGLLFRCESDHLTGITKILNFFERNGARFSPLAAAVMHGKISHNFSYRRFSAEENPEIADLIISQKKQYDQFVARLRGLM
jgi:hypothetical protein